jgi:hypothetical protein
MSCGGVFAVSLGIGECFLGFIHPCLIRMLEELFAMSVNMAIQGLGPRRLLFEQFRGIVLSITIF